MVVWAVEVVTLDVVKVSTDSAVDTSKPGAKGDCGVVTSVSDVNSQSLGPEEHIVVVELEELEDLLLVGRVESVSDWDVLSVNDSLVQVLQLNLVSSKLDSDSELITGDLASIYGIPGCGTTVSRDEGWALREVSVVGQVVVGLDGMTGHITISVKSELEGGHLEWLEPG